ncbi:hypothetical protein [Nonomuraea sp. NPDC004354]
MFLTLPYSDLPTHALDRCHHANSGDGHFRKIGLTAAVAARNVRDLSAAARSLCERR